MKLSRKNFEVLCYLERHMGEKLSQRSIAAAVSQSLGSVNGVLAELTEEGLITHESRSSFTVTEKGYEALEPHRVRRAIILAAGFGSRLVPITLNTPKALVRVRGKRMIETMLDAIEKAGIPEIIIVTGYLGEQFETLKKQYKNITLIENPYYRETNNISSAMQVKDLFGQAYVLDSDLYLNNEELIRKYEYTTSYTGVYKEKTDDWRLIMKNGRVTGMKVGGVDCYHMYDITFWTEKDGEKMAKFLPELYNSPGGKENYWDNVPLGEYNAEFSIIVRECKEGDIIEIDTLSELQAFDPSYRF